MANNEKLQLALEKDLETVRTSVDEVKKTADAALPSADLTQTKILELIDILSGGGGGTGGWHTNSDGSINGNDGTSYGSPVKYNNYWYGSGGYGGSGYSSGLSGSSGIAIITLTDY